MTDLRELAQLLKSDDPKIRKQAIIAMANSKDPRAMKALQWAYKNDPDPTLQDLALRGAKFIKDKTTEMEAASATSEYVPPWEQPSASTPAEPLTAPATSSRPRPTYDPPPPQFGDYADSVENKTVEPDYVSPKDERAARALLDRAIDFKIKGQNHKATEMMIQAFTLNPNLRFDMMAAGLAGDLLELPTEKAVAMLMNTVARENLSHAVKGAIQSQEKTQKQENTEDDAFNALFWGVIYFLVWFGVVVGMMLLVIELITDSAVLDQIFTQAYSDPTLTAEEQAELNIVEQQLRELSAELDRVGNVVAVVLGAIVGIYSVIIVLIVSGSVHVVAKALMGKGTVWGFFAKMVQYYLIVAMSFVGLSLMLFTPLGLVALLGLCLFLPATFYFYMRVISSYYDLGMGVSFVVAILGSFIYNVTTSLIPTLLDALISLF